MASIGLLVSLENIAILLALTGVVDPVQNPGPYAGASGILNITRSNRIANGGGNSRAILNNVDVYNTTSCSYL